MNINARSVPSFYYSDAVVKLIMKFRPEPLQVPVIPAEIKKGMADVGFASKEHITAHLNYISIFGVDNFCVLMNVTTHIAKHYDEKFLTNYLLALAITYENLIATNTRPFPVRIRGLGNEFTQKMLTNGVMCDFTIEVRGEPFTCHKAFFCNSSAFFQALLCCPMKEKCSDKVELRDIDVVTFKQIRDLVYQPYLDIQSVEELVNLVYTANKFQMKELEATLMSVFKAIELTEATWRIVWDCSQDLLSSELESVVLGWLLKSGVWTKELHTQFFDRRTVTLIANMINNYLRPFKSANEDCSQISVTKRV